MTRWQWQNCTEPDLMLEEVMGSVTREQLIEFVRRCWQHVEPHLPGELPRDYTVVDQFAALAPTMSNYDAVIYASEAALKSAGFAPNMRAEQRHQADLLRQLVAQPLRVAAAAPQAGRRT